MAITKTSLPTNFSFSPGYSKILENTNLADSIIIEVITVGQRIVSGQPIWVRITDNGSIGEMSQAPTGVTPFSPSHGDWSDTGIYVKNNEVAVIRYPSSQITDFTNAEEVTEYTLGSGDILYLKIDHTANTVTVYHP